MKTKQLAILILSVALCGCGVNWFPSDSGNHPVNPDSSPIEQAAADTMRSRAAMMADFARQVAKKQRAGEFREYADLEDFESALNQSLAKPDTIRKLYQQLRDEQEARLKKDSDGNLVLSGPDDAAVWEETAAGFERIAQDSRGTK
jgi:hypothetical protein